MLAQQQPVFVWRQGDSEQMMPGRKQAIQRFNTRQGHVAKHISASKPATYD